MHTYGITIFIINTAWRALIVAISYCVILAVTGSGFALMQYPMYPVHHIHDGKFPDESYYSAHDITHFFSLHWVILATDPDTIAKTLSVVGGAFSIVFYLSPKKASMSIGYGTDPLALAMTELLMSAALASSMTAIGLFFLDMEIGTAIAVGCVPSLLHSFKLFIRSESYFLAGMMDGTFETFLVLLCVVMYAAATYEKLWTEHIVLLSTFWGILQGLLGSFVTRTLVMYQYGDGIAERSRFLAMTCTNVAVMSQFTVFVLCLSNEMKPTRSYACGTCIALISLLLIPFICGHVMKYHYEKKGAIFWGVLYITAICQMLRA